MLEVTNEFNASSLKENEEYSPSNVYEKKSIFHLVKIRDKQKLIDGLMEKNVVYSPDAIDEYGEVPLMVACKHKRTGNAFTLLDFYGEKALPGFISSNGLSSMYHSITSINLTERLLTYKSVLSTLDHIFPCGNTMLTLLLSRGIIQNLDQIIDNMSLKALNHRTNLGKTALIMLVEIGEYKLCRKLIMKGVNVKYYDNDGFSALSYLIFEIDQNINEERLSLCFMCFENEEVTPRNTEFKSYSNSDFESMGDVTMTDIKSTYGEMKWAIDYNQQVKIIKFFKSYNQNKLIPDDLVKELVFIKELKLHLQNIVNLEGTYTDMDGNLHLVFEPLALTLRDYFYLLKLYATIDSMKASMAQIRIEKGYKNLRATLDTIHDLGYLHNDIKLNNIMIGYDGQLRFIDFGISNFIGFSPYERVINTYMTTTNIKAPDYGRRLIVNFMKKVKNNSYEAIRSIAIESSMKSYNSDIYSLNVSFIQAILLHNRRYVSFNGIIYEVLVLKKLLSGNSTLNNENERKKERKEKKEEGTLDLVQISDTDLKKLSKYKFFDEIKIGISIDSNSRTKKTGGYIEGQITEFKSHPDFLNNRIRHYNADELKNTKYEISRYRKIFDNYHHTKININPGMYSDIVLPTFERLLKIMNGRINIDTYYNAIYNSINYKGSSDMKVVCIVYLCIFSHLFEWSIFSVEKIAAEFDIPVNILTGNINSLMSSLLPSVTIIPFVLIVEKMIIDSQLISTASNILIDIEKVVFTNLLKYISGNKNYILIGKDIYLWDFVQCFSYTVCPFPHFEVSYESETILDVFMRFY